ncbi:hypothetical protein PybrP1_006040 [[Pythium] brassicae (nom. inval.)]|nr:hypothetical protein PybrP1_006040 [[Pythium] brassicae (nom. inval.)]
MRIPLTAHLRANYNPKAICMPSIRRYGSCGCSASCRFYYRKNAHLKMVRQRARGEQSSRDPAVQDHQCAQHPCHRRDRQKCGTQRVPGRASTRGHLKALR